MNVKVLALDALRCPVRHGVNQAFEQARPNAWQQFNNHLVFNPGAVLIMFKRELTVLVKKRILTGYELELTDDRVSEGKFCYETCAGRNVCVSCRFRIW